MKKVYLALVGSVVVLLLASCSLGGGVESESEGEGSPQSQTTKESSPEAKPESTSPAETTGSVMKQASAEVGEDGFHLEVDSYQFDAPASVAPEGTKIEVTTFQEEAYEIASARGGNSGRPGIGFHRLSSRTSVENSAPEVAATDVASDITLRNTGRGFTVNVPEGVQLEESLQVTFFGNEYTSSLQNMVSNDTAPILLRERKDGLVWGAPALLSPNKNAFTAKLAKEGTYFETAFNFSNDAGDVMTDVADQMFAKRTPRPACHGQPIETPDGRKVSLETSSDAVWACLDRVGDYVVVSITNNYPSA